MPKCYNHTTQLGQILFLLGTHLQLLTSLLLQVSHICSCFLYFKNILLHLFWLGRAHAVVPVKLRRQCPSIMGVLGIELRSSRLAIGICVCMYMNMHMEVRGQWRQRSASCILFNCSPPYCLRQGLSLNL